MLLELDSFVVLDQERCGHGEREESLQSLPHKRNYRG